MGKKIDGGRTTSQNDLDSLIIELEFSFLSLDQHPLECNLR